MLRTFREHKDCVLSSQHGRFIYLPPCPGSQVEGGGRGSLSSANVRRRWLHPRHQGSTASAPCCEPLLHRFDDPLRCIGHDPRLNAFLHDVSTVHLDQREHPNTTQGSHQASRAGGLGTKKNGSERKGERCFVRDMRHVSHTRYSVRYLHIYSPDQDPT